MNQLKPFIKAHRQPIAYLFFGGVTTAVNIATYALLHAAMGVGSDFSNIVAWILSVWVAYLTNRRWVFQSRSRGRAMLREIASFISGRLLTGLMDQVIMHLAVEVVGPRWIPSNYRSLWDLGVKLLSNVLVILLNYVLSKKVIFKSKTGMNR